MALATVTRHPMRGVVETVLETESLWIQRQHMTKPYWRANFYIFEFKGDKAALIEAGVCTEEMFPIGRKRTASGSASEDDDQGLRMRWTVNRLKGGTFQFRQSMPSQERADFLSRLLGPNHAFDENVGGAWQDPGKAEALLRVRSSSAIFDDGDEVLYFGKGDQCGRPVVILGSYSDAIHYINKDGHYLGDDGQRFDYRPGYVVQSRNGEPGFAPAYALTRADCKPSHLRLACAGGQHLPTS